ncbi:DNA-directed RNA polymerases I and III subunit RPAC2, partial [Phenoliferia sp. Uapishka_3]
MNKSVMGHEMTPVDNSDEGKVTVVRTTRPNFTWCLPPERPLAKQLPGNAADMSAATFCIMEEDHTLGNLLRWMIMKNPAVEFCGYSAPHPSEAKIHIRIQMYDGKSSLDALNEALDNLENMTLAIVSAYEESLAAGDYEKKEDLDYSFEAVNDRLWAEKEASGRGTREDFEQEKREKKEEEEREAAKLVKPKKGKPIKAEKK